MVQRRSTSLPEMGMLQSLRAEARCNIDLQGEDPPDFLPFVTQRKNKALTALWASRLTTFFFISFMKKPKKHSMFTDVIFDLSIGKLHTRKSKHSYQKQNWVNKLKNSDKFCGYLFDCMRTELDVRGTGAKK